MLFFVELPILGRLIPWEEDCCVSIYWNRAGHEVLKTTWKLFQVDTVRFSANQEKSCILEGFAILVVVVMRVLTDAGLSDTAEALQKYHIGFSSGQMSS